MQTYEQYKDSGIDWIGQIPEHWEIMNFRHTIKLRHGYQFRDNDFTESGIKIVKITQLNREGYLDLSKADTISKNRLNDFKNIIIKNDDILMCLTGGTIGKIIKVYDLSEIVLQNYRVGHFSYINSNYCNNYLFYTLFADFFQKQIFFDLSETGQPNIGMEDMKKMIVTLPPIHEQKAIAKFLDEKTAKIDALVQTKEQQIEKLKELRQAKIHQAVTKGLDTNAPTKNSGVEWIGEIPVHWEVKRLKHLMRINNGLDYKHVQVDEGYPVIGSGGQFAYASNYLYDGEVLFLGRKGTIDKPLYYKGKFWTVDTMFYCVVNNMGITKYLYYFSTTIPFKYYSTATALPSMTQGDLNNHNIPIPPIQEQEQIVAYLDEVTGKIDQAIAQKQEQITKLKEYKQSLINDVVTGKVRVC
ncbi:restriction endonuclease subunit S [Faecalibacter sp. LW9]|uniref:restriction endonuclease subunit S n=1 Tax=Faecalibacter sp. LW9 TaxID=3103144 RepID=UPI002AFEA666|nr:restriction endonuclease subunit S [Faecalibacter sp. LW9]